MYDDFAVVAYPTRVMMSAGPEADAGRFTLAFAFSRHVGVRAGCGFLFKDQGGAESCVRSHPSICLCFVCFFLPFLFL